MKKVFFYLVLIIFCFSVSFSQNIKLSYEKFKEKIENISEIEKKYDFFSRNNYYLNDDQFMSHLNDLKEKSKNIDNKIISFQLDLEYIKFLEKKCLLDSAQTLLLKQLNKIPSKNEYKSVLAYSNLEESKMYFKISDFDNASKYLDSASKSDDIYLKFEILILKIEISLELFQLDNVGSLLSQARNISGKNNEKNAILDYYNSILSFLQRDLSKSKIYIEKAIKYFSENEYGTLLSKCFLQKSDIFAAESKFQDASFLIDRSLQKTEYFELNLIGNVFYKKAKLLFRLGFLDSTIKVAQTSISYFERSYDIVGQGKIHELLGEVFLRRMVGDRTISEFELAKKYYSDKKYLKGITSVELKMGQFFTIFGVLEEAIKNFESSIKIYKAIGDSSNEALGLKMLSEAFSIMNRNKDAIDCLKLSSEILKKINLNDYKITIYSLNSLLIKEKKYQDALQNLSNIRKIIENERNENSLAEFYFKNAEINHLAGIKSESKNYFAKANKIFQKLVDNYYSASCNLFLGIIDFNNNKIISKKLINSSLTQFQKVKYCPGILLSQYWLAKIELGNKNFGQMEKYLQSARSNLVNFGNINFPNIDLIMSNDFPRLIYDLLVEESFLKKRYSDALLYANELQEWEKIFTANKMRFRVNNGLSQELYDKITYTENILNQLHNELFLNIDKNKIQIYSKQIDVREKELMKIKSDIEVENQKYYSNFIDAKVISLKNLQNNLNSDDAILQYYITDSNVYIFAVSKDSFSVFDQKTNIAELRDYTGNYIKDISPSGKASNYIINAQIFYESLIKPVENVIEKKENLYLISDRFLKYVPFETFLKGSVSEDSLKSWGRDFYSNLPYLINYHNTSYLNSINSFSKIKQYDEKKGIVLFYDPRYLIETAKIEKDSISGYYKGFPYIWYLYDAFKDRTNTFLERLNSSLKEQAVIWEKFKDEPIINFKRDQALEDNIKNPGISKKYENLYLGTYAILNENNPQNSGIVFAEGNTESREDGFFELNEIYNFESNYNLATISKIFIGANESPNAICFSSLIDAFKYSGTKNLIFPLWDSDIKPDDFTYTKAVVFYNIFFNKIKNEKLTYSEAIRKVKIQMMNDPELSSPFYWSQYILY